MEAFDIEGFAVSRILVTSAGPFTRQIGGGQSYTQDLVLGLAARGHEVTVLEPVVPTENDAELLHASSWNAIPVWSVQLPLPSETLEEQSTELSALRVSLFCQVLRQIQPDVVQINGLMPTMVRACNSLGVRHVVVAHHPGEVCPKGDLLTPADTICIAVPSPSVCGPCVLRCKKGGKGLGRVLAALPMSMHRQLGQRLTRSNPLGYIGRVLYIAWLTEQRLRGLHSYLREAQTIIAPSRAIGKALIASGAPVERVKVVNHGIRPLTRTPLNSFDQRPLRFGFVGRIDHAKGLHVLVKAMQMAGIKGKAELHVYGDATRSQDCVAWNGVLQAIGPLPWLHLHGKFQRDQSELVYAALDVVVLPAICLEGFGLVVAEAISAGRPVLATRCGGPEDQIEDGLNGWLVPPNDPVALAKQIRQLVDTPAKVEAAALACRLKKTHDEYLDQMEQIFN